MRQLQLKRFNTIFKSRKTALANLENNKTQYSDGEMVLAAYYSSSTKAADSIMYIVGIYVDKDSKKKLFTIDVESIENDIDKVKESIEKELKYTSGVTQVTASTYTTDTTDNYKVEMANDDDKYFRLKFTPVSPNDFVTPKSVGDIEAGTTAEDLKNYTLSNLLDKILFETIYPKIVQSPSLNFNADKSLYKLGETVTLTSGYTKGLASVVANNTTTYNNTGSAITASIKEGTTDISTSVIPTTLGDHIYTLSVTYDKGDELKDSKNQHASKVFNSDGSLSNQSNPNKGDTITTTISVNISLPIQLGDSNGVKDLELKTWGESTWMQNSLSNIADTNKILVKIPSGRTLAKVAVCNPLKSDDLEASYDVEITSNFKKTSTATIYNYQYDIYESTGVTQLGTQKYLIKIS